MSVETKAKVLAAIRAEAACASACDAVFLDGVSQYECELWDYKETYTENATSLGELCRDIVAFHNTYGGYLFLGVTDNYDVCGYLGNINQQTLRQKVRHYFGVDVAVVVEAYEYCGSRILAIRIPKRSTTTSTAVATRPGPMLPNSKALFQAGSVYFRANDSCQLIRGSEDLQFLASARNHSLDSKSDTSGVKQSNLPDRSAICPQLIGRADIKKELWLWLADKLSRYRVIAGPGGFGKTSAAYYFAEDVTETSSNGFMQTLWLSAKTKQFSGSDNTFVNLPYFAGGTDSFSDIDTLLAVLAGALSISEAEWGDASDQEKQEFLRDALEIIPSFVILDDLDSLTPDEQRLVVQIVMQVCAGRSKFLLTTRNNYMAPAASTTKLTGLTGEDFKDYITVLSGRFNRKLSNKEVAQLEKATEGSPLFAESVFRLMKLGSKFSEALHLWEGKDGEAARAACFKREVKQLTFKARRALFAMSRTESASLPELCRYAELERVEVEQAIQELEQLFLCSSEQIAGEPRFRVPDNLRRLLDEEKTDLVPEHTQIERRVAALKKDASGSGKSRGKNAPIALAISQSMAQLGSEDPKGACFTVDEALKEYPDSADLWMVKARCYAEAIPIDVDTVRGAYERSYVLGKREPRLFEKWIDFESRHGNTNAAVDIGEKGLKHLDPPSFDWLNRTAQAYLRRGQQRLKRGENDDASQDFRTSLKLLATSLSRAPTPAKPSITAAIEQASEGIWDAMPLSRGISGCLQVLRAAKDSAQSGDRRKIWEERVLITLNAVVRENRPTASSSELESLRFLVSAFNKYANEEGRSKIDLLMAKIDEIGPTT